MRWRREEQVTKALWGRRPSLSECVFPWAQFCLHPSSGTSGAPLWAARTHLASLKPPLCTRKFESSPGAAGSRGSGLEAGFQQVSTTGATRGIIGIHNFRCPRMDRWDRLHQAWLLALLFAVIHTFGAGRRNCARQNLNTRFKQYT